MIARNPTSFVMERTIKEQAANMFSIVILTLNEENNLPDCLRSISWCDDVIVLDSGSLDRTTQIAKEGGAQLLARKFDDFGQQRNFALDNAKFKYDWVFHLDADERFSDELRKECEAKVAEDTKSGYYVPSRLMLAQRWLKHSGCYPVYQMRFHKRGEVQFVSHGHGQREGESKRGIGFMHQPYDHYNFSKGLADWFQKHVGYASREAALSAQSYRVKELLSSDAILRRRTLKALFQAVPFRPLLKFGYLYVLRGGVLDGKAGLIYCLMHAHYEFVMSALRWELRLFKK